MRLALAILAPMANRVSLEGADGEYAQRVLDSFGQQGLMAHLGARITKLEPGHVEIRALHRRELTQQDNYFHAGVSGAIADSACGYAAYTLMPAGAGVLTVEYKMNLLAPAVGEELIARGRVVRAGRTLTICVADVYARKGEVETHCATALATIMCLLKKGSA